MFVCRSCGEKKNSQPVREGTELVTGMYTNLMSAHAGEHILGRESLLSQTSKKCLLLFTFSANDGKYSLNWGLSGD